ATSRKRCTTTPKRFRQYGIFWQISAILEGVAGFCYTLCCVECGSAMAERSSARLTKLCRAQVDSADRFGEPRERAASERASWAGDLGVSLAPCDKVTWSG